MFESCLSVFLLLSIQIFTPYNVLDIVSKFKVIKLSKLHNIHYYTTSPLLLMVQLIDIIDLKCDRLELRRTYLQLENRNKRNKKLKFA